jgi:hypothetical protein
MQILFFYGIHILGNPPGTSPHLEDGMEGKLTNYIFGNLTQWGHRVRPNNLNNITGRGLDTKTFYIITTTLIHLTILNYI